MVHNKIRNKKQTREKVLSPLFFFKTMVSFVVFFIGLVWYVPPLDDFSDYTQLYDQIALKNYIPVQSPDGYTDTSLQETVDALLQPAFHQAGDAGPDDPFWLTMRAQICDEYSQYCQKIRYRGEWTNKQQYTYTAIAVFFMSAIDQKIVQDGSIRETLQNLELRQSEGRARGLASRKNIYIHVPMIDSVKEFAEVLTHELGHVVDLGVIEGRDAIFDANYTEFGKVSFRLDDPSLGYYALSWQSETVRNPGVGENEFCSGYGASNPFEDFAECFNAYLNHHEYLYILAQADPIINQKYQYFANLFDGDYIYSPSSDAASARTYAKTKNRPWDTTKIE